MSCKKNSTALLENSRFVLGDSLGQGKARSGLETVPTKDEDEEEETFF